MSTQSIAFEVALDNAPYEKAIELVTAALKTEGFGILTRIDVRATLKEKIDADFRPYAILGACNPPLAHRALSHDAVVGLMLPCNVTVEATPAGGSMVRIADPDVFLQVGEFRHDKELQAIASEARERLLRAVSTLNASK
ncbi:MAG: DUF302 domain-containing protein [Gammaproteobacteria bacterium]|nr:DUF302 domain-containing protein [Rhodocyclaceae bacterium]MBU3909684.1 DUF302 domain-containing protein [Gammaproteobacteria bacterium]MBU3988034.1 DUF302 domain-containing protein [Gammaproteobacteria bacterium]MBU4005217.1 DUF302 domain-containing protein [Gammaproteobacteria bacterium]MBU4022396.1 DUF302 domain-containing protein [Gammaproteobacteria bacterium]